MYYIRGKLEREERNVVSQYLTVWKSPKQ